MHVTNGYALNTGSFCMKMLRAATSAPRLQLYFYTSPPHGPGRAVAYGDPTRQFLITILQAPWRGISLHRPRYQVADDGSTGTFSSKQAMTTYPPPARTCFLSHALFHLILIFPLWYFCLALVSCPGSPKKFSAGVQSSPLPASLTHHLYWSTLSHISEGFQC